jgi:cytochrome c553
MKYRICKGCKEDKSIENYYKSASNVCGYNYKCKKCHNEDTKQRHKNNKSEYEAKQRIYYEKNKNKIKERAREYATENREKVSKYQKKYSERNKEKLSKYLKKYNANNREKINKQKLDRRNSDPILKLQKTVSSLIYACLKRKGYTKRSKSTEILGIGYSGLIEHLDSNPYGFKYEDGNYDIDHIIPVRSAVTEEDVYALNKYNNLQLLPKEYNQGVKKDGTWDIVHFENWLKNNALK